MKNKTFLIPWSGGLDSTYSVLYHLHRGHTVHAPYFAISNNTNKVDQEKITRARFSTMEPFKSFIAQGKLILIDGGETYISNPATHGRFAPSLSQPIIWLMHSLFTLDLDVDYESVVISYVSGDCAVGWIDDIRDIWNAYKQMIIPNKRIYRKYPRIEFPWIKYDKNDLVDGIEIMYGAQADDIFKYIWWCEQPNRFGFLCGSCDPCVRYKSIHPFSGMHICADESMESDATVEIEGRGIESVDVTIDVDAKPKTHRIFNRLRRYHVKQI